MYDCVQVTCILHSSCRLPVPSACWMLRLGSGTYMYLKQIIQYIVKEKLPGSLHGLNSKTVAPTKLLNYAVVEKLVLLNLCYYTRISVTNWNATLWRIKTNAICVFTFLSLTRRHVLAIGNLLINWSIERLGLVNLPIFNIAYTYLSHLPACRSTQFWNANCTLCHSL